MSINDKNITKSSIHHAMDNILCDTNTNVGVEVTEDIKTPLQSAPSKTNTEDPACPPSSAPQSIEHKNLFSLRMRETLSKMTTDHTLNMDKTTALLNHMQVLRDTMLSEIRQIMADFDTKINNRQIAIEQEIEQLRQESSTTLNKIEVVTINYYQQIQKNHQSYVAHSQNEAQRTNQYSEFLQFLIQDKIL